MRPGAEGSRTAAAGPPRAAARAGALVAILHLLLATALASLLALGHVKDAAIAASLRGQPIRPALLLGALTPLDWACLLWAGLAVLPALALEWRHRAITTLLHEASPGEAFALLTGLLLWTGHGYLFPGLQLGGDVASHIVRFNEVAAGLRQGVLPDWTNFGYMGAPLLWFTGPLTYAVGGALTVLVGDANRALKLLMLLTHVAAGWAFWALARRWGVRPLAAATAAALFGGAFANLHLFFYRGETPQTITIPLLVLLFWAADGLLRGVGRRWANAVVFALATAGLILNHQPHALFAAIYLALFGAVALGTGWWRPRGMGVPGLGVLVLAGVLGVVASLVAVLPVLFESDWVMIQPEGALVGARLPSLSRLLNLVVWHATLTTRGINYWAYLGLGLIVLAATGVVGLARGRLRAPGVAAAALACFGAGLVLYNPVVRDVLFLLFFGAILAAQGLDWLIEAPVLAGRRLTLLLGVAAADLMSTAIQPVARVDKGFLEDAGRHLAATAPGERVVQISIGADGRLAGDIGPDGSVLSYAALVQRLAGNHNMAATPVHNDLVVAIKRAEAELGGQGHLSAPTRALLGLFNVGRIVCNSSIAMGCPASFAGTADDPVLGRTLPIEATPALFATSLVRQDEAPGLAKPMLWEDDFTTPSQAPRLAAIWQAEGAVLATELPDFATHRAAALSVPGQSATAAAAEGPLVIRRYSVGLQAVRLALTAPGAGWVQLAHPWIPSTIVRRNGETVAPIRCALGLTVVPVPAGDTEITLEAGGTAVRRAAMAVSALGLLGIAVLGWMLRRRAEPPGTRP